VYSVYGGFDVRTAIWSQVLWQILGRMSNTKHVHLIIEGFIDGNAVPGGDKFQQYRFGDIGKSTRPSNTLVDRLCHAAFPPQDCFCGCNQRCAPDRLRAVGVHRISIRKGTHLRCVPQPHHGRSGHQLKQGCAYISTRMSRAPCSCQPALPSTPRPGYKRHLRIDSRAGGGCAIERMCFTVEIRSPR
jgi:hypothetical protein